jgi:endonuclease G
MLTGYSSDFLGGNTLSMPEITQENELIQSHIILSYTNFTVNFCISRKVPVYTAVNIHGKSFVQINRESTPWRYENALTTTCQIGEDFYPYTNGQFHKGHIVRRIDVSWGAKAVQGQVDTFHYTNACPQHKKFNPAIWLELERNILEKGAVEFEKKLCVFAGPVLSNLDKPSYIKMNGECIFIPSVFWKVVIWNKTDGRRAAVGFMQSQKDLIDNLVDQNYGIDIPRRDIDTHLENLKFKNDEVYQVDIKNIEKATGLKFPLHNLYLPAVPNISKLTQPERVSGGREREIADIRTANITVEGMNLD